MLEARGKQLIATVNLFTLPELHALPSRVDASIDAGMFTRDAQGDLVQGWGGYQPNPIHPTVRQALLNHVGEVLRRYGRRRAFGGLDIWRTQADMARQVLEKAGVGAAQVVAIGITNQRETTVVWDRESGNPLYNAIVWQCRRTAPMCDQLRAGGWADPIRDGNRGIR